MRVWVCFTLLIWQVVTNNSCVKYLMQLQQMSKLNPDKFKEEMTPYLVLSGKGIDDLGFPQTCLRDSRGYSYSTVEISIPGEDGAQYSGYVGFCFTDKCNTADLNGFAGFLINYIFEEYNIDVHPKFIDSPMELEFSPLALVMCLTFLICIGIGMAAPVMIWVGMCRRSEDEEFIIKSVYVNLDHDNENYDEEIIHETSTLIERLSLKYKWKELWKGEDSQKIYAFSLFRVLALPLFLYGQIFWLSNQGAFNYYAFWEELYGEFFVKFAVFAYYVPDIFFFISAFLFTQKLLQVQGNELAEIVKAFGRRIGRLYPLYFAVLLIYWCISPSLHGGPVWYQYQDQAAVCNHAWWRVLLLIDNWFPSSCYPGLWFVQAEVQYALVICLFFVLYYSCRQGSYYVLAAAYLGSFLLLMLISAEMPTSFDVALQDYTQIYFRSSYSHFYFSLTGLILSILANKESVRLKVQQLVLDSPIVYISLNVLGFGLSVLILLRPWVWLGKWSNPIELALCREGILLAFCIFFLQGMFRRETHRSVLHKYGYYMYPVYLVSWMVVSSNFWSGSSLPYISGEAVLNLSLTSMLVCLPLGIFLGLVFDLRTLSLK